MLEFMGDPCSGILAGLAALIGAGAAASDGDGDDSDSDRDSSSQDTSDDRGYGEYQRLNDRRQPGDTGSRPSDDD